MSWGELRALTLDKLDKTLASGGANGPDSLLEEEYGGLLYKTLDEAWQTDNLSSFCVTIFDKIYRAMTNRGFYWIDLTEASTVLALREAFVECENHEKQDAPINYELDHILRIGRHVTPDEPAMRRYASSVRREFSKLENSTADLDRRVVFLNRVYRARRRSSQAWMDVLWEASVLGMTPMDDGMWKAHMDTLIDGTISPCPTVVEVSQERIEDGFDDLGVTVTVAEGVTLTDEQRNTMRLVVEHLNNDKAIVLLGDRTCMALELVEARYGFDYLVESVREEMEACQAIEPLQEITYLHEGTYLVSIFGTIYQIVRSGEYPTPPEGIQRDVGIPLPVAQGYRDRALMACARPSALAVAVPHCALPDDDTRGERATRIQNWLRGSSSKWGYKSEEWTYDEFGEFPLRYLEGIWHSGEGVDHSRYGHEAFIAHSGREYVTGRAADAHLLSRLLDSSAKVVVEVNERAIERLHHNGDQRRSLEEYLSDKIADRIQDTTYIIEDIEEFPDEFAPEELSSARACLSMLTSHLENIDKLISRIYDIDEGTVFDSDDLLLLAGYEHEADSWWSESRYFRFENGGYAHVRRVFDEYGVDAERTLSNTERICATEAGAYINPEALEMRDLLRAFLEAERKAQAESEARRQKEEDERRGAELESKLSDLRGNTSHLIAEIISKEAQARANRQNVSDDIEEYDGVMSEVSKFTNIQPTTLADALLYLDYLKDMREAFDLWYYTFGVELNETSAIGQRLIWEYSHRNERSHQLWSLDLCNRTPFGEYAKPGKNLKPGLTAIVIGGPFAGRVVRISEVNGKGTRARVEFEADGTVSTATFRTGDLLSIGPTPGALERRAGSFNPPSMSADMKDAVSRILIAMFELARFQPAEDDNFRVSEYLYYAGLSVRLYHRILKDLEGDATNKLDAESYLHLMKHYIAMEFHCDGIYDLLDQESNIEEYCRSWDEDLGHDLLIELRGMMHRT